MTLVNQALTVGILIYSFALFVVPWLEEFEVNRGSMMMSIFLFQVFTGLASPVVGRLLDTDMLRRLVLIGAVFLTGGLALLSQVTAFWQILVLYCTVLPIAMVLCGTLASQTMVSKWFTEGRGLAIGISAMGTSIGGFIFPLVTAELIVAISWQSSLLVLAGVAFLLMVPLNFVILRHAPPPPDLSGDSGETHLDAKIWTTKEILSTRSFWIPVAGFIPVRCFLRCAV